METQKKKLEKIYFKITFSKCETSIKCIPSYDLIKWYTPCLVEEMIREDQELEYLTNPPTIQEGIFECKKCSSKRVLSFSKQTRRGDESTSVFALCDTCKHQWKE